jgi:epoxyqueuosine reductase QueG
MNISARAIKKMLLDEGIDLVGIADASDLLCATPPRPATDLMPTAQSVIVMAVAHSLGAVYAPSIRLWTRNKMQTSRLLDSAAEKVARLLERNGHLSLPVSADKPVEIHKLDPATGRRFPHTKVIGHLSLKHAAVSAGLGQIGRSNLLLTERFGPHQRLGAVITEAVLEPDRPRDLRLCIDSCRKCEESCPVGALREGRYDVDPCFNYWSYGFDRLPPRTLREWPGFMRMLLRHLKHRDTMIEYSQTMITDVDFCIACMKSCPVGSEWKKIRPAKNRRTGGTHEDR